MFRSFLLNSISILMMIPIIILVGWISDRIKPWTFLLTSAFGMLLISYPLLILANKGSVGTFIIAQAITSVINAVYLAPTPAIYTQLFESHVRYSCVSIGINLSAAVFGGTAPVIMAYFNHFSNAILAQSIYLIASAVDAIVSIVFVMSKYSKREIETSRINLYGNMGRV
jgi:MFS transporter, MHS family, proline/betaine transporter